MQYRILVISFYQNCHGHFVLYAETRQGCSVCAMNQTARLHSTCDLTITRLFRAPPLAFWRCWSEPSLLSKWWAPSPILTLNTQIDLVPGGRFHAALQTPDGAQDVTEYCILHVDPERRIVLTDTMTLGWRPVATPDIGFTATVTFDAESGGTRYTVRLHHATPAICQRHEALGFHESWGIATSQLGALAETRG
jgi:uncharacterized protein YndB with AHSA1/START domain